MLSSLLRHHFKTVLLITALFYLSSCYTYRISTQAQPGTEISKTTTAHAFFWGLLQSPKDGIKTPNCDSLNINGMSLVKVKTNLGFALITVATLGIWCPVQVEWKCGKPCQVVGKM